MNTKLANRLVCRFIKRTFPQLANFPRVKFTHDELRAEATYVVPDSTGVLQPRTEEVASSSQAGSTFTSNLFLNFMLLLPAHQAVIQHFQTQAQTSAPHLPKPDPHAATSNLSQVSTVSATQALESSAASTAMTLQSELDDLYAVEQDAAPTGYS